MAIVNVKSGKPIPIEIIEKAPDCAEKRLVTESHGICDECVKSSFPSLRKTPLAESIM
jgi:hypothetical protein